MSRAGASAPPRWPAARALPAPGPRAAARRALLAAVLLASGCAAFDAPAPAPTSASPSASTPSAAAAPAAAASAPAAAASAPREAQPRYDDSGRLVGLEEPGTDRTLITPGEAAVATPTLGLVVEIEAPPELKTLLERHLDLVRLGQIGRDEVDESEWSRLTDAAPAQVRELLLTEGYFAPRVTLERHPRRASGEPDRVRLVVEPGVRARVSRVTLEAQGDLERAVVAGDDHARATLDRWRADWRLKEGSEFRNPAWGEAKSRALSHLRAAGYATANWAGTSATVDAARNEVRLFVVIDSGPLFRLGTLQIDGLNVHDAETVRDILNTPLGAPVTEQMLLDFQERLVKSRLFESVNVILEPDVSKADESTIAVRVREAPLQSYTVGLGISANTGLRTSLETLHRRLFGYPLIADNKFEWAQKRRAWEGEISTYPGENLYRWLVAGSIEWLEGTDDVVLSERVRAGRARDTSRVERLVFVEAERSERTTDTDRTTTVALSLNYHGVWRRVDSVVLPTEGFSLAAQVGVGQSHGNHSLTGPFSRAYGRFTGYLPLPGSWYGQGRLEVGQVFLKQGVLAPESQRWRAGGDDSVRGYEYRSLGPVSNGAVGSGNVVLTTSIELARPISADLPSVWGAVFYDAGNAADSFSGMKLAQGYGVGVRWRSPVGPLRLDVAYGERDHRYRLHFSVGIVY